jgi:hypothetical protein
VVLSRQKEGLRLHRLVFGPPIALPGSRWRTKADRGLLLDPPLDARDVAGQGRGDPGTAAGRAAARAAGARLARPRPRAARARGVARQDAEALREPLRAGAGSPRFGRAPARMVGRRIGDEYVLVPLAGRGADLDSILNLNSVAAFVWEQLDGSRSGG